MRRNEDEHLKMSQALFHLFLPFGTENFSNQIIDFMSQQDSNSDRHKKKTGPPPRP